MSTWVWDMRPTFHWQHFRENKIQDLVWLQGPSLVSSCTMYHHQCGGGGWFVCNWWRYQMNHNWQRDNMLSCDVVNLLSLREISSYAWHWTFLHKCFIYHITCHLHQRVVEGGHFYFEECRTNECTCSKMRLVSYLHTLMLHISRIVFFPSFIVVWNLASNDILKSNCNKWIYHCTRNMGPTLAWSVTL